MTRRETAALAFSALIAIVAVVVYVRWGVTATERVHAHFGIDASTKETIREGLLREVGMGASEQKIVGYLERSGIGDDQYSSMEQREHEVRCTVWSDDRAFDWGSESAWLVDFEFDGSKRLREITVRKELVRL